MKIAIPTSEGKLCMHFGHCQTFAILQTDPETKTVASRKDLTPPPHEPGVLPKWLGELGVDLIIAGGMGQRAQQLFVQQNIQVVTGAPALPPEEAALAYLNNTLTTGVNACDH